MLDQLNSLDTSLLLFFNHMHNAFLDFLMYWVSNKWIWIPLYAYLAFFLYRNYHKYFYSIFITIVLLIVLSDQVSSSVIKNMVLRLRPCHDPSISNDVHLVYGYCGGMYGFVSSHSANAFALATFFSLLIKKNFRSLRVILFGWALLVSYSRIYLGAHYPGDVIGGAIVGIISGFVLERAFRYYELNSNSKVMKPGTENNKRD